MDEAVALLKELGSWQKEGLITNEELIAKRAQLFAEIRFPTRLSKDRIHDILQQLIQLKDDGIITEDELKGKRTQALSSLYANLSLDRFCVPMSTNTGGTTGPVRTPPNQQPGNPDTVDSKYFSYYADFAHQELMLNDAVRTGTYYQGIMRNAADFQGKVVVDIGAGSGILAMFAARAGAKKVYAVEASDMAHAAANLVQHNGLSHVVTIVKGKVEDVQLPEKADILVSEPLGFWLLNEQMIQSYIVGRDKWLLPGGQMYPAGSKMAVAGCYLPEVYKATAAKSAGWQYKTEFYGLDFTTIEDDVKQQNMSRIIIDQILPTQVVTPISERLVDFTTVTVDGLNDLKIPFSFHLPTAVLFDSIGMWFDTYFHGSPGTSNLVWLHTNPHSKLTCWYQTILLLPTPITTSSFEGYLHLVANSERTYDVTLYTATLPPDYTAEDKSHQSIAIDERGVRCGGVNDDGCVNPNLKYTKVQTYSFTSPVYRYYDHFNDLIWDPTNLDYHTNQSRTTFNYATDDLPPPVAASPTMMAPKPHPPAQRANSAMDTDSMVV